MYLADTLSRAYIEGEPETSLDKEMSNVVHSLVENTTVSAVKMDEIHEASDADLTLCQVKRLILDGWPKTTKKRTSRSACLLECKKLHIADGVIFFGERVVLPLQLRDQMLCITTLVQKSARPEPELFYTGQVWAATLSKLWQNALSV